MFKSLRIIDIVWCMLLSISLLHCIWESLIVFISNLPQALHTNSGVHLQAWLSVVLIELCEFNLFLFLARHIENHFFHILLQNDLQTWLQSHRSKNRPCSYYKWTLLWCLYSPYVTTLPHFCSDFGLRRCLEMGALKNVICTTHGFPTARQFQWPLWAMLSPIM